MPDELLELRNYVLPIFSGDFAAQHPQAREIFTWEMAEQWGRILNLLEDTAA